jgi:hypothetical protein
MNGRFQRAVFTGIIFFAFSAIAVGVLIYDFRQARLSLQTTTGGREELDRQVELLVGNLTNTAPKQYAFDQSATKHRLRADVRFLASDRLRGRGTYTPGIDLAAKYIAQQFAVAGLDIKRFNNSPFQRFSHFTEPALGAGNELTIRGPKQQQVELEVGKDFTPLSVSHPGNFELPLAFVGYGITAPALGYDDYADIDVAGKAVIVLRHEPQQDDPSSVFDGTRNSKYAFLDGKIKNAARHGAKAFIFCSDGYSVEAQQTGGVTPRSSTFGDDRLLNFDVRGKLSKQPIPVIHCRREFVDHLLTASSEEGLASLERLIDRELRPASRDLPGWEAAGSIAIEQKANSLKNVVGVLAGQGDIANEVVVIGAHYDHLGMGGFGTLAPWTVAIHNGADDNASGTAAMMEIARRLAARRDDLQRSVMFIAFSAEEKGLIGSEHYVSNPLFPMKNTVAMLNLDMVGRLGKQLTINGTGTATQFESAVSQLGTKYQFPISTSASGYGPSDHSSFHARGVPVLHFFTGLHEDYHRPSDDYDKLNYEGMCQITDLVTDLAFELATAAQRPEPTSSDTYASILNLRQSPGTTNTVASQSIDLGVTVDSDLVDGGLKVTRILKYSLAAEAGMRTGDVILYVAGQSVSSAAEMQDAIERSKSAGPIALVVRRTGLEIELTVAVPDA